MGFGGETTFPRVFVPEKHTDAVVVDLDKKYASTFPIDKGTSVAVEISGGRKVYVCGIEHNTSNDVNGRSEIKGVAPLNWKELLSSFIGQPGVTDVLISYLPEEVENFNKLGAEQYSKAYIYDFFGHCTKVASELGKRIASADIANKVVYEVLEVLFAANPVVPFVEVMGLWGIDVPKSKFKFWFDRWNEYTGHGHNVTNRELLERMSPNDARRLLQAEALLTLAEEGKCPAIICAPAHAERIKIYLEILSYHGRDPEKLAMQKIVRRKLEIYKRAARLTGLSNEVRYAN
ncbi:MAG TPA: hypothetical protein PK957_00795 [Candidatus Dojkabacteria bacterium]|nr:hypothetical protein [Candidatus Dojkabacteria bacterium]